VTRLTPMTPPTMPMTPPTPVDPRIITISPNSTTAQVAQPSLSVPSVPTPEFEDHDREVARLKAELEALSRRFQEHQRQSIHDPQQHTASPSSVGEVQSAPGPEGTSSKRRTRKRPVSQVYKDAIGIERESADEREVRRVEKSTKKTKTTGAREEMAGLLSVFNSEG
jgi:hypothetical protein